MRKSLWLILPLIICSLVLIAARGINRRVPLTLDDAARLNQLGSFSTLHKFGFNSEVDGSEETIYEGNDNSGPARIIIDTSAFTLYISSDNAADTEANNVTIVVEGLDASWDSQSVTVSAAGNTAGGGGMNGIAFVRVGAASSWMRINRAYNSDSAAVTGTIYLHSDGTDGDANGIPDEPTNQVRTIVSPSEDQTLQAFYTIPNGYNGLLRNWCVSALTTSGTTNAVTARLRMWPEGGVGRTQERTAVANPETVCIPYDPPLLFTEKTGLEVTGISSGAGSDVDVSSKFDMVIVPEVVR
jgi:hypothetical protein